MNWMLIIVVGFAQNVEIAQIPMETEEHCIAALEEAVKTKPDVAVWDGFCVQTRGSMIRIPQRR